MYMYNCTLYTTVHCTLYNVYMEYNIDQMKLLYWKEKYTIVYRIFKAKIFVIFNNAILSKKKHISNKGILVTETLWFWEKYRTLIRHFAYSDNILISSLIKSVSQEKRPELEGKKKRGYYLN